MLLIMQDAIKSFGPKVETQQNSLTRFSVCAVVDSPVDAYTVIVWIGIFINAFHFPPRLLTSQCENMISLLPLVTVENNGQDFVLIRDRVVAKEA